MTLVQLQESQGGDPPVSVVQFRVATVSDLTSMHIWNVFSLVPHFSDPQSELEEQNSHLSAHASRQLPVIKYPNNC